MPATDDPLIRLVRATASPQLEALRDRRVVAAVSGGADSIAMLHSLLSMKDDLGLASLCAAHLDHLLRPESSGQAESLRATVSGWGLELVLGRCDVRELATRERLSVEAAAREARYRFLASVARDRGAVVAVAHNQQDQAETVLLNLVRGSGISGLSGMKPVGALPGATDLLLVRPLLGVPPEALRGYCARHGLPVLEDPTNVSLDYARNRIRHTVIPRLLEVNERAVEHISAAANLLRADEEALGVLAADLYGRAAEEHADAVVLSREELTGVPEALVLRVLRLVVLRLAGGLEGVGRRHLLALLDLLRGDEGRALDLPHGLGAANGWDRLMVHRGPATWEVLYPLPLLDESGEQLAEGWEWAVSRDGCACPESRPGTRLHEHVRASASELVLRPGRPRESFRPLGMGGEKRVARFLLDSKVPRPLRGRVPVVATDGGIVWVVGHRIDDRWRLEVPGERGYLCLCVRRG